MFDFDVFVLGGGPAGLAAAIAARKAGFSVLVADAECPPIDKACGEGLMPDSVRAAGLLGISIPSNKSASFRGIRFHAGEQMIVGDFPEGTGVGVRRTALHPLLVDRAQQIGVELLWRSPVTSLVGNKLLAGRTNIRARWIIGADGAQSFIRRWAGLQQYRRDSRRYSFRRHFRVKPWSTYMELYWGDRCQFYVTPIGAREVCVVLMTRNPRQRIHSALPLFPALATRLSGHDALTSERGALAATRRLKNVTARNTALIGDASGSVDPITGEGLCLAFQQASVLADSLGQGDLGIYERAHARLTRRPRLMADLMLLMDRSPSVRARVMQAFQSRPRLFSDLLATHVGKTTTIRFAAIAAELGWQVASC